MALTREQSISKYGTEAYTAWDEGSAEADFRATGGAGKIPGTQPTPQQLLPPPTGQPNEPRSAQDLINMGFYGYQGWGDPEAIADYRATGGQGKGSAGGTQSYTGTGTTGMTGTGLGSLTTTGVPDLPSMYANLMESSGISEKESRLRDLESKYLEAKGKISDNPFLSASMIDQRLQRLDRKYEQETAPIRNEIAVAKADIETQLDLQTKQFDINSQQTKLNIDIFNTMLDAGALDNASGADIASFVRSTGIPSSMIYSAIEANKAKNVKTNVISYDDGTNQGFVVYNELTGEIISKQAVASSKPREGTQSERDASEKQQLFNGITQQIDAGATWDNIYNALILIQGITDDDILRAYRIYASRSRYRPDSTTQKQDLDRTLYSSGK